MKLTHSGYSMTRRRGDAATWRRWEDHYPRVPAFPRPRVILRARGFTLIETLAALLLLAIVLPAAMRAVTTFTRASTIARQQTEAANLAQSKLNEMIATQTWQTGGGSGDFADDGFPDYRWTATLDGWTDPNAVYSNTTSGSSNSASSGNNNANSNNNLQQLTVTVDWQSGNDRRSLAVSALVYDGSNTPSVFSSGGQNGQ